MLAYIIHDEATQDLDLPVDSVNKQAWCHWLTERGPPLPISQICERESDQCCYKSKGQLLKWQVSFGYWSNILRSLQ